MALECSCSQRRAAGTRADLTLVTRFKPISGKQDQAGGLVFRVQDKDNYYILRANDGRLLASGGLDGTVRRETPSGRLLATLEGHTSLERQQVLGTRQSPDAYWRLSSVRPQVDGGTEQQEPTGKAK